MVLKVQINASAAGIIKFLKEIEGRVQDYVIDKNGNPVPLAPAIFNYNDMDWKNIEEFKILQSKKREN